MKHLKFILPAMLILSACGKASTESPGSQNVTYLDMEQVLDNENLKSNEEIVDLIESLNVVQLETTDNEESFVGEYVMECFVDGDNIIVIDYSNYPVKFFDAEGKFKFAIRKGEGPDDVLPHSNYSFDYDNHLIMTSMSSKLRFFNLEGKAVKDSLLDYEVTNIQKIGDRYAIRLAPSNEVKILKGKRLAVTDAYFKPIVGLSDHPNGDVFVYLHNSSGLANDCAYCMDLFCDTIFFVKDTSICDNLVIKSNHKFDVSQLPSPDNADYFSTEPDGYIYRGFIQAGNTQRININRPNEGYLIYRNAKSGNTIVDNDKSYMPVPSLAADKETFMTTINGFYDDETRDECLKFVKKYPKFSKYQDIFEKYNEETDNPILIFFKMKDF